MKANNLNAARMCHLYRWGVFSLLALVVVLQAGCACLCRSGNFNDFGADIVSKHSLLDEIHDAGETGDKNKYPVHILKSADPVEIYALVYNDTGARWLRRGHDHVWTFLGEPPYSVSMWSGRTSSFRNNQKTGIADNLTYQLAPDDESDSFKLLGNTWYPHALAVSPGGRGTILQENAGMRMVYFSRDEDGTIKTEEIFFGDEFHSIKQLIEYKDRHFICSFSLENPKYYSFVLPSSGSGQLITEMERVKWERIYRGTRFGPASIDVDQKLRLILVHEPLGLRICDGSLFSAFLAPTINPLTYGYRYSEGTNGRPVIDHIFTQKMFSSFQSGQLGYYIVPE